MYYLYILRRVSDDLYIGITHDLPRRVAIHNLGRGAQWTKTHKNAQLVYSEKHSDLASARKREIQLKKWSQAKKAALIAENITKLK